MAVAVVAEVEGGVHHARKVAVSCVLLRSQPGNMGLSANDPGSFEELKELMSVIPPYCCLKESFHCSFLLLAIFVAYTFTCPCLL